MLWRCWGVDVEMCTRTRTCAYAYACNTCNFAMLISESILFAIVSVLKIRILIRIYIYIIIIFNENVIAILQLLGVHARARVSGRRESEEGLSF
jgi:hypothetical protein